MKNKKWFEVSKEGLRQLWAGKPKDFIVRELVQNAWDEKISKCSFTSEWQNGIAYLVMEDDSPEGFKDITHAFTLFAPTYKRLIPEKRGRFNVGEKQVLAMCKEAIVSTTKGTVTFSSQGRIHKRLKREKGSIISLTLRMKMDGYKEMLKSVDLYLPPKGIDFRVNDNPILYKEPYKVVEVSLPTEIRNADGMVKAYRKTKVNIHKAEDEAYLYEMGLPVCKINCLYHVDVQQKVPMSIDRNKVTQSYLRKIFTLVLNETYELVPNVNVSDGWVREAMSNKDISDEAVKAVVKTRYGDKVVVANPTDRGSIDDALSHGYKVIYGNELSRPEWKNIRKAGAIKSSSALFPTKLTDDSEEVEKDENMVKVEELTKKIAKRCLGIDVNVQFFKWTGAAAQYGLRSLTFNVKKLGRTFFDPPLSDEVIDLILHELAHEKGFHTEVYYHSCLTRMAGELIMLALDEPEFFELRGKK